MSVPTPVSVQDVNGREGSSMFDIFLLWWLLFLIISTKAFICIGHDSKGGLKYVSVF